MNTAHLTSSVGALIELNAAFDAAVNLEEAFNDEGWEDGLR